MKHKMTLQDYATCVKVEEQTVRRLNNSFNQGTVKHKSNTQGLQGLQSEVKNRLGMNQASNIWRTVENTKRVTVHRTGGIYHGYKY
jgi:hypothetical protein